MRQSDTFFKPKPKNKQVSYAQSKSKFSLVYFIIYFYVCAQVFFFLFMEDFERRGNFMCCRVFRISASHRVRTHVLIVPCVVRRMSNSLRYNTVRSNCVYKRVYFEWNNANYNENKRLMILLLKILALIILEYKYFYFTTNQQP